MNHTAFVPFVNEILSSTKTKDPTNDYYPDKLYVDTETGTYGGCAGLVVINTFDWSEDDTEVFGEMTDRERNRYAIQYGDNPNMGPAEWLAAQ